MRRLLLLAAFLLAAPLYAADKYVSATGSGTTCSTGSPCLPVQLMSTSCPVAGTRIRFKDGTYNVVTLGDMLIHCNTGTAANRLQWTPENPWGVIVNCGGGTGSACFGTFGSDAAYNDIHGFKVHVVSTQRRVTAADGSGLGSQPISDWESATKINGTNNRFYNNEIRDTLNCFQGSNDPRHYSNTWYGNLCQYAGYVNAATRGSGHSVYIQQDATAGGGSAGRSLFRHNISDRAMDVGYQNYSSGGGTGWWETSQNVEVAPGIPKTAVWPAMGTEYAMIFGSSSPNLSQDSSYCGPVAGSRYNQSPIIDGNTTYQLGGAAFTIGYVAGVCNPTVTNNVWGSTASGGFPNGKTYATMTLTGNYFFAAPSGNIGGPAPTFSAANYPTNTWLTAFPTSGADLILYRPNEMEACKGFVVVYNWDLSLTASINLASAGGCAGQAYEVYGYQDFDPGVSTPIATGTCGTPCGSITVNTSGLTVHAPAGTLFDGVTPFPTPLESGPRFNVYIIQQASSATTPTATVTNTPTSTNTPLPSSTPTRTFTPSNTATPTRTFTPSNTPVSTSTPTLTFTTTPSNTATFTPTRTPTATATPIASLLPGSFEAEGFQCAVTSPARIVTDTLASGGSYVDSSAGDTVNPIDGVAGGKIACSFSVASAGTYRFWFRTYAPSASADSMFVSLDGGTVSTTAPNNHIDDIGETRGCTDALYETFWNDVVTTGYVWKPWNDRALNCSGTGLSGYEHTDAAGGAVGVALTVGAHTIDFYPREALARLDAIIVTPDLSYDPSTVPATPTPLPGSCTKWIRCHRKWGPVSIPCSQKNKSYTKPCPW